MPPSPPPPQDKPLEPLNLREGEPLSGIARTKYIKVVWDAPVEREMNLLPVTRYELLVTDPINPAASNTTIKLYTGAAGGWGGPSAGHALFSINGRELVPGQNVSFEVRACNSLGCGLYSELRVFQTKLAVPATLKQPILHFNDETTISVEIVDPPAYTGGSPILRYEVETSTLPADVMDGVISELTANLPGIHTLSGRQMSHAYTFRVRAVTSVGKGLWSNKLFIPGGTVVLASMVPANLAVKAGTVQSRSLNVSWTLPPSTRPVPAYYRLRMYALACPSGPTLCPTSGARTTSYVNVDAADPNCTMGCEATITEGLRPSTKYDLAISSMTYVVGSNVSLPTSTITPADVPQFAHPTSGAPTPPVVRPDGVGETYIDVEWDVPLAHGSAITGYEIRACDVVTSVPCVSASASASALSARVNLLAGRTYTLSVQASNGIGGSGYVTVAGRYTTYAPPERCEPVQVADPLPGLPRQTSLRLKWAKPFENGKPINGYVLNVDGEPVSLDPRYLEYTVVNLYPGSWHNFSVYAKNEIGDGAPSAHAAFRTDVGVPATLTIPVLYELSFEQIFVQAPPALYSGGSRILRYEVSVHIGDAFNGTLVPLPMKEGTSSANETGVPTRNYTMIEPNYTMIEPMLAPGTVYNIKARAVSEVGPGIWSPSLRVVSKTHPAPASPPGHLGAVGDGGNATAGNTSGAGAAGAPGDGGDAAAGDTEGAGAAGGSKGAQGVAVNFVASGDVAEYTTALKAKLADAIASGANLADANGKAPAGSVVTVTAGSVNVAVSLPVGSAAEAAAKTEVLSDLLGSKAKLNAFLQSKDVAVTVESEPVVKTVQGGGLQQDSLNATAAALGANKDGDSGSSSGAAGGLMGVAAALLGISAVVLVVALKKLGAAKKAAAASSASSKAVGAGEGGDLRRQKAELEAQLAKLKAEQAAQAAKAAAQGAGNSATMALEMAAVQSELALLRAQAAAAGGAGGDKAAGNKAAGDGGDKEAAMQDAMAAAQKKLAALEAQRQEALAHERSLEALASRQSQGSDGGSDGSSEEATGGKGAEAADVSKKEHFATEADRLRAKLYAQPHFEPGIDDAPSMEVNPVLLHDIIVQKRVARETKSAEAAKTARGEVPSAAGGGPNSQRKRREGAPQFGQSGGLARLNLNVGAKQNDGAGNLETLRSVQAYLSGQGVSQAQDKMREHCTRPGAFDATALQAAHEMSSDHDHLADMARAARTTRQHTRPANAIMQRLRASESDAGEDGRPNRKSKKAMSNVTVDLEI